jgi:hypothetical protein
MPWVIFEATTGWGCGKDQQTLEYRVRVPGAVEAEELADRLAEYGNRPHRHPEPGDKGLLILDESLVHEGCIYDVRVENDVWSSKVVFEDYDTLMEKCLL